MLRACFALVDFVDLIPVRIARTPEWRTPFSNSPPESEGGAAECGSAAMGALLQFIGDPPDDQIMTEPQRRSGVMQCPPGTSRSSCVEFFGFLYHLNACEEPELRDYPPEKAPATQSYDLVAHAATGNRGSL
jgi:hypothetical protein